MNIMKTLFAILTYSLKEKNAKRFLLLTRIHEPLARNRPPTHRLPLTKKKAKAKAKED